MSSGKLRTLLYASNFKHEEGGIRAEAEIALIFPFSGGETLLNLLCHLVHRLELQGHLLILLSIGNLYTPG